MKFMLYTFSKLGDKRPSEILVFEFGNIVLISDDQYLVEGFGIERVEILNEENTLEKVLASFTDDGYMCDRTYNIDLPRGDDATRLILDYDRLGYYFDRVGHCEYFGDDSLFHLESLSKSRKDIVAKDISYFIEAMDDAIEACEDRPDWVERATNLKQRFAAFNKDADNMKEGK